MWNTNNEQWQCILTFDYIFCRLIEGTYSHSAYQWKWRAPDAFEVHSATLGKGFSGGQSATPEASGWIRNTRQHSERLNMNQLKASFNEINFQNPVSKHFFPRHRGFSSWACKGVICNRASTSSQRFWRRYGKSHISSQRINIKMIIIIHFQWLTTLLYALYKRKGC